MNNIVFVGFMGSGKTTLSKVLYKELVKENPDIKLIDTDAYIEEKLSRKISDIFANEGEAYFRDIETETLRELADAKGTIIVSCGGGIVERKENLPILKSIGTVVFANTPIDILWKRVGNDPSRPLSKDKDAFFALYNKRLNLYTEVADVIIDTGNGSIEKCVETVRRSL